MLKWLCKSYSKEGGNCINYDSDKEICKLEHKITDDLDDVNCIDYIVWCEIKNKMGGEK
jgi:hypothetical protein